MSKKLIAGAGVVASLAVALAPLATYADIASGASDTHTDEIVITLQPSCTFGDANQNTTPLPGGITHGSETGTTYNTTTGGAINDETHDNDDVASTGYGIIADEGATTSSNLNASEHTILRTMQAGTVATAFASTTMKVVCTNVEGYSVKITTPDLVIEESGHTENIPASLGTASAAAYSASASGYDLAITADNGDAGASDIVSDKIGAHYANATAGTAETVIEHSDTSAATGDTISVSYGIGVQGNQRAGVYSGKVIYSLFQGIAD